MPVTKQHPPPAQPWIRETAPAAPFLTNANTCSACGVRPLSSPAGKVCPDCFALLQHEDWGAAERKRRDELKAQQAAVETERREARRAAQAQIAADRKQLREQLAREALDRIGVSNKPEHEP